MELILIGFNLILLPTQIEFVMAMEAQSVDLGSIGGNVHTEKHVDTTTGSVLDQTVSPDNPFCDDLRCNNSDSTCYCDELCSMFEDCCIDMIYASNHFNGTEHDFIIQRTMLHKYKQHFKCQSLGVKNYLVVGSCNDEFVDDVLKENCEGLNHSDIRNIALSMKNQYNNGLPIVFRNRYCASCHGINLTTTEPWITKLECKNDITEEVTIEEIQRKCKLVHESFPSEVVKPRICLPQVLTTCSKDLEAELSQKCEQFLDPVVHFNSSTGMVYKNEYCMECNGIPANGSLVCGVLNFKNEGGNQGPGLDINFIFSFSFEEDGYTLSSRLSGSRFSLPMCDSGKVFSDVIQECVDIECPKGYIIQENSCSQIMPYIYKPSERNISVELIIISPTTLFIRFEMCSSNITTIDINTNSLIAFTYKDEKHLNNFLSNCVNETFILKNSKREIRNFVNSNALECTEGMLIEEHVNTNFEIDDVTDVLEYRTSFLNFSLGLLDIRFTLELDNTTVTIQTIWYCTVSEKTVVLNCLAFIGYNKQDFDFKNGDASHTKSGKLFQNGTYILEGSKLFVCAQNKNMEIFHTNGDLISNLTLTCLCVSIIALSIVLIIHCCFPELRNLHGKCLMSFASILALTQMLILFQQVIPKDLCRMTAALQHYGWFTVFTWTGVIGFDLARRLNSRSLGSIWSQNDSVLFMKYSICAWGIPMVVVLTCVILDVVHDWKFIKYGSEELSMCWIGNSTAHVIAFVLPFILILVSNVIFFIVVICGVESAKKDTKVLRKSKQDTGRCVMYTKISFLLGLTWVSGLLASMLKMEWLYIANTIVNGSQGLFLLIAILYNGKLRQIVRRRKYKSRRDSTRTSTLATSI